MIMQLCWSLLIEEKLLFLFPSHQIEGFPERWFFFWIYRPCGSLETQQAYVLDKVIDLHLLQVIQHEVGQLILIIQTLGPFLCLFFCNLDIIVE